MAYYSDKPVNNFETDADLSSSPYMPVRLSSEKLVLAANGTTPVLGPLTDSVADGSTDTANCGVRLFGIGKVKVGTGGATALTFGTGGTGGWTDAAAGEYYGCMFLEAGASGAIISAIVCQGQLDSDT